MMNMTGEVKASGVNQAYRAPAGAKIGHLSQRRCPLW
ncbi:Uncharacterised protein [uncultured archaeon]|nr:Uncharacterised protein [uncultured archaeon]